MALGRKWFRGEAPEAGAFTILRDGRHSVAGASVPENRIAAGEGVHQGAPIRDALANPAESTHTASTKADRLSPNTLGVMVSRLTSELAGMTMN